MEAFDGLSQRFGHSVNMGSLGALAGQSPGPLRW